MEEQQMHSRKGKRLFLITTVCVLIGSIVRIAYCLKYPVPVRDSYEYMFIIREWIETNSIPIEKPIPPLGLFLMKIPTTYFGYEIIKGGIVINILLGLLIIITLIKISDEITPSPLLALCIGILSATHPTLIRYSCEMLRENSFLLFSSFAVISCIRFLKGTTGYLILASICLAAGYLCRHEGIEFAFFFGALILFNPKIELKKRGLYSMIYIVLFMFSLVAISLCIGIPKEYYYTYLNDYKNSANIDFDDYFNIVF